MKVKNIVGFIVFMFLAGILVSYPVYSQQAQTTTEQPKAAAQQPGKEGYDPAKDPDSRMLRTDNYLQRFKAVESIDGLMKDNLERIYLLKVITSNFDVADWKQGYQNVYKQYRDGLQNFYQRRVITANSILEENRKSISDLLKKVSEQYKKDTEEMLDVCAKAVLIVSLNKLTRYDPDKNQQLYDNMSRLRVAYGEVDGAYEASVDHKYMYSIYHYRVAKSYAIQIMNDLINDEMIRKDLPDPEEERMIRELIDKKKGFDIPTHIADNQNKIKERK